jgi:glycosyltransferase involved in cell wall biosynthesis
MSIEFSIIIPARNEEAYIGKCLESIAEAAKYCSRQVEVIVVLNRCTDGTERIAREYGAVIARDDSKNLSRIRNTGEKLAQGEILLTIDADSTMSLNLLTEVASALSSGKVIGGGVLIRLERLSAGIILTFLMFLPLILWFKVSAGCFWCRRKDFEAIGGFDENRLSLEDFDFARRLRVYGQTRGKKFKTLIRASVRTSCRKFDHFGDWYLVKHPFIVLSLLRGGDHELPDRIWYDVGHGG